MTGEMTMKKKQDSLITKQRLLETAFQNFYEVGFENTSLDKISRDANVSRGAAYWHFKNKSEIFGEVVRMTIEKIKAEKRKIMQDEHLSFKEKVIQILVVPSQNQEGFKFMQQSLKTLEVYPEFAELLETFRETRGRLYEFFLEGLKREGLEEKDAAAVSSMLYNYFEGMYGSGTPEEVTKNYTTEAISRSISIIFTNH
jgi:TetR/AcrR family acrAB operon transcriptional repressor